MKHKHNKEHWNKNASMKEQFEQEAKTRVKAPDRERRSSLENLVFNLREGDDGDHGVHSPVSPGPGVQRRGSVDLKPRGIELKAQSANAFSNTVADIAATGETTKVDGALKVDQPGAVKAHVQHDEKKLQKKLRKSEHKMKKHHKHKHSLNHHGHPIDKQGMELDDQM